MNNQLKQARIKGINEGIWICLQQLASEPKQEEMIESIIISTGLSYNECVECMNESEYNRDILESIVNGMNLE